MKAIRCAPYGWAIRSEDEKLRALVPDNDGNPAAAHALALKMAAAPTMLGALEKAENFFAGEPFQSEARECLAAIEHAISLARGEAGSASL